MREMEHSTPHVFAPTDDEFEVGYRCLLCGHSAYRKKEGITAHRQNHPRQHYEYITIGLSGRLPSLEQYDKSPSLFGY